MISTHAPHAECDNGRYNGATQRGDISTHAPHAECDEAWAMYENENNISTHAPHAECDRWFLIYKFAMINFNSRTPRGVRLSDR